MALNEVIALIFTVVLCILAALILPFAAIPVEVIFGPQIAGGLLSAIMGSWAFRIVYLVIFINLMMDTYKVPNLKSLFFKRRLVVMLTEDKQAE
ncbi:MAG: hypothetical protein PHH13_00015 [Candidatus Peribacteraceae bacterium]|nr:hypothetical protein [Candidatus Peribacteraceae bacterium]